MRKSLIFPLLLCILSVRSLVLAQTDPHAYRIYTKSGEPTTYTNMIKSLGRYDIVLFGESHNCPIAHWLEVKVAESLYAIHGDKLIMGAEMLESDVQIILDEYLSGLITADRFEAEARLWPNHETDYAPFIYFAKEHHIPFIATNVPRRYANSVSHQGLTVLDSLSADARQFMAPLPLKVEEGTDSTAFSMMAMMGGNSDPDKPKRMQAAQSLKDATMAYRIVKAMRPGAHFLHIHGRYHSDNYGGIPYYIKAYAPERSFATISVLRDDQTERLDEAYHGIADFIIIVPSDMTNTY